MSGYEEKVLNYCSTRILPEGYKINDDWRRKLITLVEDAAVNHHKCPIRHASAIYSYMVYRRKNTCSIY